jgi:hypothetical protein
VDKKILQVNKNAIIYPYNQGWLSPSTQPNSSWWGKANTKPASKVGIPLKPNLGLELGKPKVD